MKKLVLTLVVAIGMISSTFAQSKDFCFQDVFGYSASVTATRTGVGYWSMSGTANVLTGYDWSCSGYMDKSFDTWVLTFTNTMPDGCAFYVDAFTYTAYDHGGGTIYCNWTSYCAGSPLFSGTVSTDFSLGLCAFRTGEPTPGGPAVNDEALAYNQTVDVRSIEGAGSIFDLLPEPQLSVVRKDETNFTVGYELTENASVSIDIYNHAGQYVTTLVSDNQSKGFYTTSWNSNDATSGMYIAILRVNGETISKKFVK